MSPILIFFSNDTPTTEIYTLSLHDALPISLRGRARQARPERGRADHRDQAHARGAGGLRQVRRGRPGARGQAQAEERSEEHTSELQSLRHLVCRLLLEKKKKTVSNIKNENV